MLIRSNTDTTDDVVFEQKTIRMDNDRYRMDIHREFIGNNEFGNNRFMYSKQSSIGSVFNRLYTSMDDAFSTIIDVDTGEIVKYASITTWPFGIYPSSYQFGLIDDVNFGHIKDFSEFTKDALIVNSKVEDNTCLCNTTNTFEDYFQLHYLPIAGMLLSFFSTTIINYPHIANYTLDSNKGFNIINVQTATSFKEKVKEKIKSLIPLIATLFADYKMECDKEKRHILSLVTTHEYGVVIKIIDIDHHMNFTYNINLSDHCRILQSNEIYNAKEYASSNLFNTLVKLGVPTIVDTLGSVPDISEEEMNI